MLPEDAFLKWLDRARHILARPTPPSYDQVLPDERDDLIEWKVKKWSILLLHRNFERCASFDWRS